MTRAYEEIVDFIAGGSTPEDVIHWTPSDKAKARVRELLEAEKAGTLQFHVMMEFRASFIRRNGYRIA